MIQTKKKINLLNFKLNSILTEPGVSNCKSINTSGESTPIEIIASGSLIFAKISLLNKNLPFRLKILHRKTPIYDQKSGQKVEFFD